MPRDKGVVKKELRPDTERAIRAKACKDCSALWKPVDHAPSEAYYLLPGPEPVRDRVARILCPALGYGDGVWWVWVLTRSAARTAYLPCCEKITDEKAKSILGKG